MLLKKDQKTRRRCSWKMRCDWDGKTKYDHDENAGKMGGVELKKDEGQMRNDDKKEGKPRRKEETTELLMTELPTMLILSWKVMAQLFEILKAAGT
jgi:hypothetical protein